jgi:4-amino-4-deoxychorismate lyase
MGSSASLFFETIRIEDGIAHNLSDHNHRLNRTRAEVFGAYDPIDLGKHLMAPVAKKILRCRVVYGRTIEQIEYLPYSPRPLTRFALVHSAMTYPYKALDRSELNALFARRGAADEIIIVSKEGFVRDTSIANIALEIEGRWLTPAHPLLPGTQRARMLARAAILPADLRISDLKRADRVAVMNAMVGFRIVERARFIGI